MGWDEAGIREVHLIPCFLIETPLLLLDETFCHQTPPDRRGDLVVILDTGTV
jgi:ABC-type thiamine transport system ATPase subunit